MAYVTPVFNNWLRGEVSELMQARVDLEDYAKALSMLQNMVPLPQGGLTRRPGTYFVANGKVNANPVRLIPYERGTEQNYIIELGSGYARFYTNHARIENPPGTAVELTSCPWTTDELADIQFAQDDDELYLVHRNWQPQMIKRTTNDYTWTRTQPIGAPFNSSGNYPGSIAFWQGRMCLAGTVNKPQTVWGSLVGDYTVWNTWLLEIDVAPTPADWAAGATITGVTSGVTSVVVQKVDSLHYVIKSLSGTYQYAETLTDGTNSRACTAGYPVVTPGAGEADPWEFPLASERAQVIQWLVSGSDLLVGCSGGEFIYTGGEAPFYAKSGIIRQQSTWGSKRVQAVLFNERCLFIQKTGDRLREMYFTYERNGYVAPDVSALAAHMVAAGVNYVAAQRTPEPILWLVTAQGELKGFAYDTSVGMAAWAHMPMEGVVESVAVITSGAEDELWLSVADSIGGTTKRFIMYMKPRYWGTDNRDMFFVDNGITVNYGNPVNMTGATKADPIVVTASGHGLSNGQFIKITSVGGMTQLNGKFYQVQNVSGASFELWNEDGTDGIDGTFFYLEVATAPTPADFAPGATLTGATSGVTAIVFQKVSSTRYLCRLRSGTYTDGEDISDGTNTAAGAAGYPLVEDLYGTYTSGGTVQRFSKVVGGLTHLAGEEVDVLVDGATHPSRVVSGGGEITLQLYGNRIQVGKEYVSKVRLMRASAGGDSGSGIGKLKKINKVTLGFYNTMGVQVGPNEEQLTELEWRLPEYPMGEAPALFSGFLTVHVMSTWDRDGWFMVVQDQPLPVTLTMIMPYLETREL